VNNEILVALITGGLGLVAAISAATIPRIHRQGRALEVVKEQVVNSHRTNLRDDLDVIRDEMREGFRALADAISNVNTDLAWERRERMDLAERLTGKRPAG